MTALYIQQDYIKIDCDNCGAEVCLIKATDPVYNHETVRKPFMVFCRQCRDKK